MIDLIILALIAYFIIRKLKSILGEESDEVYFGYNAKRNNNESIKDAEQIDISKNLDSEQFAKLSQDAKINATAICNRIKNFSLSKFQDISVKVLEQVIKANNDQNNEEIRKFLSKELAELVISSFKKNEKNNIFLVSLKKSEVVDVIKTGDIFDIKIQFDMEQISYITNENNEVIDGSKNEIINVEEIWTFTHDFNKKDRTWFVSNIQEI